MKLNITIAGALFSAFASTLCCLPPLLFLFFGISSGFLSYFTTMEYLRIPMALISIIFLLYFLKKQYEKISCQCTKQEKIKKSIFPILLFFIMIFLLFYPELIPLFMEFE